MHKSNKAIVRLRCAAFAAALAWLLLAAPGLRAQPVSGETPLAVLTTARGEVSVKRAGAASWEPARGGTPLNREDLVRTGAGAAAMISFGKGGSVNLPPMSEMRVEAMLSPGGGPCPAVVLISGGAWVRMSVDDKDKQFLVITDTVVVNGQSAGVFIEAQAQGGQSCLDVFRGQASIRPLHELSQVRTLAGGQRILLDAAADTWLPAAMDGQYNENATSYSCMGTAPQTADAEDSAQAEAPAAGSSVEFAAQAPPAQAEAGAAAQAAPDATAQADDSQGDASQAPAEEELEEEYEMIVVSVSAQASVRYQNAECDEPPVISDVMSGAQILSQGDLLELKSVSKCGARATPEISWTATPRCGGISSMSVTVDKKTTRLPGNAAPAAFPGKFTADISDNEVHDIKISVLDDSGRQAAFAFQAAVAQEAAMPPPRVKNLTVNSMPVKDKADLEMRSDVCEDMLFLVEGEAESDCGEIALVTVTAHELPVTVYGTEEWEASLYIKEEQTVPVIVTVRDVTGAQSPPYKFNIEYSKEVTPPRVEISDAAGYPVSAFGEPLDIYRNDLTGGRLVVSGGAGSDMCYIRTVEVSVDGGSSWDKASGGGAWSYGFIPRDGDYEILARSIDNDGNESEEMFMPLEITYYSKTREEILQEAFEALVRAYQDRDADTILTGSASSYSSSAESIEDRSRLDSALNGKFSEISSVYLRYRVDSVTVSGSSGRVTFQWDADPGTSGYSKTGTFVFQKEGRPDWKLLTVQDSRSFLRYTTEPETITVSPFSNSLTANNTDTTTVTAVLKDAAGNAVKNGTPVQFSASTGTIDTWDTTTDGRATATYTASDTIGFATITAESGGVSSSATILLEREYAPGPPDR